MLFATVLYVATYLGGCGWTIYAITVRMDVSFWKFSKNPPNSASVDDAMMFIMVLHSTCTGPIFGGITVISVLLMNLGQRKTSTWYTACLWFWDVGYI